MKIPPEGNPLLFVDAVRLGRALAPDQSCFLAAFEILIRVHLCSSVANLPSPTSSASPCSTPADDLDSTPSPPPATPQTTAPE